MVDCFYVGSSRTGSTWLYKQLDSHPDVHMPIKKPVRFWNMKVFGHVDSKSSHPNLTLEQYQGLMKSEDGKRVLDMTDGYNVLDTVVISNIKKHYPKAKILFTLRNPVDIYISHQMLHSSDVEFALSKDRVNDILNNPYSYQNLNGAQSENIERWANYFGNENVYCMFYDFMCKDPLSYICNVSDILGISKDHWESVSDLNVKVNKRKTSDLPPKEIVNMLYDRFLPEIKNLERVLDVDLSDWKNGKISTNLNKIFNPRK